jgi:hypothetical protein
VAYSFTQLQGLWTQGGGPAEVAPLMAAIALAESGGDAGAENPSSGACGLWQIHPAEPGCSDPQQNAQMAVRKYRSQGLGAWEAYTNGSYQKFLPAGSQTGSTPAPGGGGLLTVPGKGLMQGQQVDRWGIAQGIADAAGYTGGSLRSAGQSALDVGTLGAGLLVVGAGLAIVAWLLLTRTDAGRSAVQGVKHSAEAVLTVVALAPK